jgi:spore coat polysaccharide biosynthesis protein SpsF
MTVAAIVQARLGSSRLPGKVLMDLGGRSVLAHVLARCQAIPGVDTVVCATTQNAADDAVARAAGRLSVPVFRGSETDVLARYAEAALSVNAATIVRVTSDCPLIDPAVCGEVLLLVASGRADYACNNMPPSWPHGLDCEAFTAEALAQAAREATDEAAREHVTPWMRDNPTLARANLRGPGGVACRMRWTLDYPEDLAFLAALFDVRPGAATATDWKTVAAILDRHPEIAQLNAARIDAKRHEGDAGNFPGVFQV